LTIYRSINAVVESWFSTLKVELIHRQSWPTRAHARRGVFDFIERFYNRTRLHSSLGYRSPAEYEATITGSRKDETA
jgi:transposase InsO family protein